MVKGTALTKLMSGDKVRASTWDKDKFISMNKEGQIVDNESKIFNIMTAKEKKWEIYKEPTVEVSADNAELVKMLKLLTDKVETLTEAVGDQDRCQTSDIDSSDIADEIQKALQENRPQEEQTQEETVKIFYGVSSLKDVRELFKTELLNCNSKKETILTVSKFIPYCWMGGRKLNTVARYYTDMRNVIKDIADEYQDLALDIFSIPAEVYEQMGKENIKKVLDKLEDKEVFDAQEIKDIISDLKVNIEKTIKLGFGDEVTAEDYKKNDIPIAKQQDPAQARAYLYASYLAFVTGRRSIEILKTLEIVKHNKEWFYKGITKKGFEESQIKAYSLDNDFEFLNGLIKQLRKDVDTKNLKNTEVNSKYNHIFNRSFKRITGTNYTFHDAREIFAELAYIEFGKKLGTDREEIDFKSSILGHEINKDRLVTTEHYMTKKGE